MHSNLNVLYINKDGGGFFKDVKFSQLNSLLIPSEDKPILYYLIDILCCNVTYLTSLRQTDMIDITYYNRIIAHILGEDIQKIINIYKRYSIPILLTTGADQNGEYNEVSEDCCGVKILSRPFKLKDLEEALNKPSEINLELIKTA